MSRFVASAPRASAVAIAALRACGSVEVLEHGDRVWIRGEHSEQAEPLLRAIPGAQRFLCQDERLYPEGARLPVAVAPQGEWIALEKWLVVALPPAQQAAASTARATLCLVRAAPLTIPVEPTPTALLTTLAAWSEFAESAPRLRLDPLRFAACADDRVLVRGMPLPPLPGTRLWACERLLVECGWHWSPQVAVALVERAFLLEPGDLLLWTSERGPERLQAREFAAASRIAIRETAQELSHGR